MSTYDLLYAARSFHRGSPEIVYFGFVKLSIRFLHGLFSACLKSAIVRFAIVALVVFVLFLAIDPHMIYVQFVSILFHYTYQVFFQLDRDESFAIVIQAKTKERKRRYWIGS